jgi:hypothetical protein
MEDEEITRNVLYVRRPEALPGRVHGTLSCGMKWVAVASPSGAVVESCVHACVLKYERKTS